VRRSQRHGYVDDFENVCVLACRIRHVHDWKSLSFQAL